MKEDKLNCFHDYIGIGLDYFEGMTGAALQD